MDASKELILLQELANRVSGLERRVRQLEGGLGQAPQPRTDPPAAALADPIEVAVDDAAGPAAVAPVWSNAFARLALACFALVGALVLRVVSQQGLLPLSTGVLLGLSYAGLLLVLPLVFLKSTKKDLLVVLGYCGAALAPLIALEGVWRLGSMAVEMASLVALAAGLLATVAAGLLGARGLAAFGLVAALVGVFGLGLRLDGLAWRGTAVALLAGAGVLAARRNGWDRLRPLVLPPALALLAVGLLSTGRRAGLDPMVPLVLLGDLLFVCLVVAGSHGLARRRPVAEGEAVWLPLAAFVFGALAPFLAPLAAGLGCAALGLGGLLAFGIRGPAPAERAWACASAPLLASLFLTTFGLRSLDPSGAALAVLSTAALWPGLGQRSNAAVVFSPLVLILAVIDWFLLGSGLISGAILVLAGLGGHLLLVGRAGRGPVTTPFVAPLVLLLSLLAGFFWTREAAASLFGDGRMVGLVISLAMVGAGVFLLVFGRRREQRAWTWVGLLVLAALAGKVLLVDLFSSGGVYLLGSVAALGGGFVAASLIFRGRDSPAS